MDKISIIQQAMAETGHEGKLMNQIDDVEKTNIMFSIIDIMERDLKINELFSAN